MNKKFIIVFLLVMGLVGAFIYNQNYKDKHPNMGLFRYEKDYVVMFEVYEGKNTDLKELGEINERLDIWDFKKDFQGYKIPKGSKVFKSTNNKFNEDMGDVLVVKFSEDVHLKDGKYKKGIEYISRYVTGQI
ncbi:MAG: hypothetical protein RR942_11025 [Romboutsia sp.]